jgi:hypothetical protein
MASTAGCPHGWQPPNGSAYLFALPMNPTAFPEHYNHSHKHMSNSKSVGVVSFGVSFGARPLFPMVVLHPSVLWLSYGCPVVVLWLSYGHSVLWLFYTPAICTLQSTLTPHSQVLPALLLLPRPLFNPSSSSELVDEGKAPDLSICTA